MFLLLWYVVICKLKILKIGLYLKWFKRICCLRNYLYIYYRKYNYFFNLYFKSSFKSVLFFSLYLFGYIVKSFFWNRFLVLCMIEKYVVFLCGYSSSISFESGISSEDIKKVSVLLIRKLYILM